MLSYADGQPVIRFAEPADREQLQLLWQEAFGDSKEETAFYFTRRHRDENMLVFAVNGEIRGMLSLLPLQLVSGNTAVNARYVFAVATKKQFRGLGIAGLLLEEAHRFAAREGCEATLLVPADEGLFHYYSQRGYSTMFSIDEFYVAPNDLPEKKQSGSIRPCGYGVYKEIRDMVFSGSGLYARWGTDAMKFIQESTEAGGGAMLKLAGNNWEAAAVCEDRGDCIRVTELAARTEHVNEALALIHSHFKAARYQVRLMEGLGKKGSTRPFGMVHWLSQEKPGSQYAIPYLAFAKD